MSALISLLMPTRGRPRLAERFLRSAAEHADDQRNIQAVIYADDDDQASHALDGTPLECITIVGPRISMGACNSVCLEKSSGDIVVLTNDDVVIRTPGWDTTLRALHDSMPDRVYLAYPNDLFKGRRLCTFPILSRRTCDLLADPFPRTYQGAFIDYHLLDIFKRLERKGHLRLIYLDDVVFEHMHYRTGKSAYDETYRRRARFDDDAAFLALRRLRSVGAARLARAIEAEDAQKPSGSLSVASDDVPARRCRGVVDALSCILLDAELPYRWRLYLVLWFAARMLAARGWIPRISRDAVTK